MNVHLIAALGAVGLLFALQAFGPSPAGRAPRQTLKLPAFTDNQSNGNSTNKLTSTKFPLFAVIKELSAQMGKLGARIDELGHHGSAMPKTDASTSSHSQHRNVWDIHWTILEGLLSLGSDFQEEEEEERRKASDQPDTCSHQRETQGRQIDSDGPLVSCVPLYFQVGGSLELTKERGFSDLLAFLGLFLRRLGGVPRCDTCQTRWHHGTSGWVSGKGEVCLFLG